MAESYKFISLAIFAVQAFMGWFLWSMRKEFVSQSECNARKINAVDEFGKLKTRTHHAEKTMQSIEPLVQSVQKLSLQVERLAGEIRAISKTMEKMEKRIEKLEDYIIHGGKKRG